MNDKWQVRRALTSFGAFSRSFFDRRFDGFLQFVRIVRVVERFDLKIETGSRIQIRVASLRLDRVGTVIFVEVFGRGLGQQAVNGLAFGEDLQRCHPAAGPRMDGPAGVERTEPSAGASRTGRPKGFQQAVAYQAHEHLMAVPLQHPGGILGCEHGREIEHGHVRLSVVIDGEIHVRQLVIGWKIGRLPGVIHQCLFIDVFNRQQLESVRIILLRHNSK